MNQEVGDNFNQQVDSGMDMTTESTPFTSRYSDNFSGHGPHLPSEKYSQSKRVETWAAWLYFWQQPNIGGWICLNSVFIIIIILRPESELVLPEGCPEDDVQVISFLYCLHQTFPFDCLHRSFPFDCLPQTFLCSLLTLNSTRLR